MKEISCFHQNHEPEFLQNCAIRVSLNLTEQLIALTALGYKTERHKLNLYVFSPIVIKRDNCGHSQSTENLAVLEKYDFLSEDYEQNVFARCNGDEKGVACTCIKHRLLEIGY